MEKITPNLLLRVAIAFAFLYPAIDSFIDPDSWVTFFPPFVLAMVSPALLLYSWSAVEIVIALWILSGVRIFIPSLIATAALLGIVAFNMSLFQVVFRDVALACVAAALALGSVKHISTG